MRILSTYSPVVGEQRKKYGTYVFPSPTSSLLSCPRSSPTTSPSFALRSTTFSKANKIPPNTALDHKKHFSPLSEKENIHPAVLHPANLSADAKSDLLAPKPKTVTSPRACPTTPTFFDLNIQGTKIANFTNSQYADFFDLGKNANLNGTDSSSLHHPLNPTKSTRAKRCRPPSPNSQSQIQSRSQIQSQKSGLVSHTRKGHSSQAHSPYARKRPRISGFSALSPQITSSLVEPDTFETEDASLDLFPRPLSTPERQIIRGPILPVTPRRKSKRKKPELDKGTHMISIDSDNTGNTGNTDNTDNTDTSGSGCPNSANTNAYVFPAVVLPRLGAPELSPYSARHGPRAFCIDLEKAQQKREKELELMRTLKLKADQGECLSKDLWMGVVQDHQERDQDMSLSLLMYQKGLGSEQHQSLQRLQSDSTMDIHTLKAIETTGQTQPLEIQTRATTRNHPRQNDSNQCSNHGLNDLNLHPGNHQSPESPHPSKEKTAHPRETPDRIVRLRTYKSPHYLARKSAELDQTYAVDIDISMRPRSIAGRNDSEIHTHWDTMNRAKKRVEDLQDSLDECNLQIEKQKHILHTTAADFFRRNMHDIRQWSQ